MSFDNALKSVTQLVNDFKANENHYLNPSYSEADVRNDFINKFFIALGWDVRHETQKNPYEQEKPHPLSLSLLRRGKQGEVLRFKNMLYRDKMKSGKQIH